MTRKHPDAFFLAYIEECGIRRLTAHPVTITDEGVRSPLFAFGERATELADFEVSAYLDAEHEHAWGFTHRFKPFDVDVHRAEAMVRVLRRVDRGLTRTNEQFGDPTTFYGYLTQIAHVLGITGYVVASDSGPMFLNGSGFHYLDATEIESWIEDQERSHGSTCVPTG